MGPVGVTIWLTGGNPIYEVPVTLQVYGGHIGLYRICRVV